MSANVYEPARKLIEGVFKPAWNERTPCKFENIQFTRPANNRWCAFSILFGKSLQISIGQVRDERHPGFVTLQIFVPVNGGTVDAVKDADFAANIFRMQTIRDADVEVIFRTPEVTKLGEVGGWYQVNMSVEFQLNANF